MAIWFEGVSIEQMNERGKGTLSELLQIEFTELGENYLKATMPVTADHKQPIGLLHGGANVVLAETLASTAANCVIDIKTHFCVGLEINANHLRAVKEGMVTAITTPIHLGRTTQVWQIEIFDEAGKKTCISRMTASVLKR